MSSISSYILSIVGIVFLGVLVDVVMPDGEMNKYVKGIFSLVALFVIISPIQTVLSGKTDLSEVFYDTSAIEIDSDFLEATNKQIKKQLENTLLAKLKNAGFDDVEVEILCDMSNNQFEVKKVVLDISKMVINSDVEHINKYTEVRAIVLECLNVEESDVIINE